MNIEDFREYCLSKPGVTEKMPFGRFAARYDSLLVFYVMDHMFCIVDVDDFTSVTVRSTPDEIASLRQRYRSTASPQNPALKHWIQLDFGGDITEPEILLLTDRAYEIIRDKYSRKKKTENYIKS